MKSKREEESIQEKSSKADHQGHVDTMNKAAWATQAEGAQNPSPIIFLVMVLRLAFSSYFDPGDDVADMSASNPCHWGSPAI